MSFINCHIHTFTIEHIPNRFLPFRLVNILKPKVIRKPLGWILRRVNPFTDRDLLDRYINFIEITANKTQEDTFKKVQGYYPRDTKFIILPMDMEYMAAGKVKVGLEEQLEDVRKLYTKFPDAVIPFIAVDPRRKGIFELVKKYIEVHGFRGIKIYPRLGFYPNDKALKPIYEYAQNNKIPVLSHCSRGGVYTKRIEDSMLNHPTRGRVQKMKAKDFSHYFTEPRNYVEILTEFPNLKLCLAHFGGNSEWDSYLEQPWDPDHPNKKYTSWVPEIVDMMKEHTNLYTDISYTAFHSDRYFPLMSIFLDDEKIKDRILFGSDYYMVEREKVSEREVSLKVRYALGEEKFELISTTNVSSFLEG